MGLEQRFDRAFVLFVEDHQTTRDALTRLLQSEGFRVDPAPDGTTGLALARSRTHDVILLDLCLPDTSGLAVLAQLRREGIFIPCVILTGFPGCQSGFEAGRLGAVSYLVKPTVAAELVSALSQALDGSCRMVTATFAQRPVYCSPLLTMLAAAIEQVARNEAPWNPEIDETAGCDLARVLALAADNPKATLCQFVAIAYGLRVLLEPQVRKPLAETLDSIRASFSRSASYDALPLQPDAESIITTLQASGRALRNLRQEEVASALHLTVTRMCTLLDEQYGLSYSECRLAVLMRRVLCELVRGSEHVRQIAYHAGYEDHGNFDRTFRGFFGVTPTQLRRLRTRSA